MKRFSPKIFVALLILIGLITAGIGTLPPKAAHAYSNNDMIDDSVFDNTNSMSAAQIQTFLNQFPNSCIKNYQAPDPQSWYNYGGLVSAAQVIKDASTIWGINPQVLLTTMEKEEGLVRGDGAYGCSNTSYWSAMGYNCPGSATYTYSAAQITASPDNYTGGLPSDLSGGAGPTCAASAHDVGFSAQVSHGAWQLEFGRQRSEGNGNLNWDGDNTVTYGGYMTAGTRVRVQGGASASYSGVVTLNDGNTVTLANGATASLYSYTPYIQSFDPIFEGFFGTGSTSATAYQWSFAGQTSNVSLNALPTGQEATLTVSATNTGAATWTNSGSNPVRLGTDNPEERQSAFATSSWVSPSRPATLTQSSVAPGQTGTFSFVIQAPTTPGTYKEYFNLLDEGNTWMNDPGLYFQITVVNPSLVGTVTGNTLPTSLNSGTTASGTVSIRNDGNVSWYNNGRYPIRLGSGSNVSPEQTNPLADSSWVATNRPAAMTQSEVDPGQTATFTFTIDAPRTPGSYTVTFDPVAEGYVWFSTPFNFTLTSQGSYTWSLSSQAAYTDSSKATPVSLSSLSPGQTAWLVVNAVNTGTATWTNSGSNPVRIGTAGPLERKSIFATSNWISPSRPATMAQSSVAPSQTGTFEFPIQVPNVNGNYFEHFDLLAEGNVWMNDIGLGFSMTVHNGYSWQLASQFAYTDSSETTPISLSTMTPGETVYVGLTARNTGTATWYNSGSFPLDLGASHPQDRVSAFATSGWFSIGRPARMLESSVAPGQTGTFEFTYQAPTTPGTYLEYFTPVAENITWLNDIGLNFYTVVE